MSYSKTMLQDSNLQVSLDELEATFEKLQSRLNAAKTAYLNGSTLDGKAVEYEDLKRVAEQTIQANYDLQKARYGTIRLKLSVSKLLRRGR